MESQPESIDTDLSQGTLENAHHSQSSDNKVLDFQSKSHPVQSSNDTFENP